jgi:hypothetical protein
MLKIIHSPKLFVIVLVLVGHLYGQSWSGILSPSRAIDWSNAGVVGGIPNRTTICTTLNPGASNAQINTAIQNCPSGQVVFLNAGTYSLSGGINMKSNVTLRGAGANQTLLSFSGSGGACAAICFEGENTWPGASQVQAGGSQAATWTSGYAQGANQIVLNSIGSAGISVGQYIYLDQDDDATPTGNFFVCSNTIVPCSLQGPNGGRNINGNNRGQHQIVKVTACSPSCSNGATFTITPPLYAANWSSSHNPGAWWSANQLQFAGLENVSIDDSNDCNCGQNNVSIYNAFNSWVSGIRSINASRSHIQYAEAAHNTVQNSYFYGTKNATSQSYGVESYFSDDDLTVNNIYQRVTSPMMTQLTSGNVFLYNYDILDFYCDTTGCNDSGGSELGTTTWSHNGGVQYTLWEGNTTSGYKGDWLHGNGGLQTAFRNRVLGWMSGTTKSRTAIHLQSYNRAYNLIGNVLGYQGFHTSYQGGGDGSIYTFGDGSAPNTPLVATDSGVATTVMRWGNYDVVNAAVRFVSSEVPSGIGAYANALPASQTLPASFYYSSKPGWWPSAKPWPPIGPDVTGGNVGGYGGHANTNPAQDCYTNVMGGSADGTGSVLSFNAANCYTSSVSSNSPNPPSGLTAVVN